MVWNKSAQSSVILVLVCLVIIICATSTSGENTDDTSKSLQEAFLLCIAPIILLKITFATYVYKAQQVRGLHELRWAVIVFVVTIIGFIIWSATRTKISPQYSKGLEKVSTKRALIFIGVILLIIGLSLTITLIPLITHTPQEYDEWVKSKNRKPGDSIIVAGTIAEKGFFWYRFEGSATSFLSAENIGDGGDFVIVDIQIDSTGAVVGSKLELYAVLWPGILITTMGAIIVVIGFVIGKKAKTYPSFIEIPR